MKNKNRFIAVALALLMFSTLGFAAISVAENTPTENSTFCQSVVNNIDLNINGSYADGNKLYRFYIGSDTNLWVIDDGNGNVHPDFNAVYGSVTGGIMQVRLTIPPTASTGNQTITIVDLNDGVSTTTQAINIKPTWTSTLWTTSPLICTIADYTAVSGFKLTPTTGNGYVQFDNVNVSGTTDFDTGTEFTSRKLTLTTAALVSEPATVEFSKAKIGSNSVEILKNGSRCNNCSLLQLSGDLVRFKAQGFSTYEVRAAAVDGDLPPEIAQAQQNQAFSIAGFNPATMDNATKFVIVAIVGLLVYLYVKK